MKKTIKILIILLFVFINSKAFASKDGIEFSGKVVSNVKTKKSSYIIVSVGDEKKNIKFYYDKDTFVIKDTDFSREDPKKIEIGDIITVYFDFSRSNKTNSNKAFSPVAVVLNKSNKAIYTQFSKYNEKLLSSNGLFELSIAKDTLINDYTGKVASREDLYNKNLLVFFSDIKRSSPSVVSAKSVIILSEDLKKEANLVGFDHFIYNDRSVKIKNKILINNGEIFIPIRDFADFFKYKVEWVNSLKMVKLEKNGSISLKLDKDEYESNDNRVIIGREPFISGGSTYVPVSFVKDIMGYDYYINHRGRLVLK